MSFSEDGFPFPLPRWRQCRDGRPLIREQPGDHGSRQIMDNQRAERDVAHVVARGVHHEGVSLWSPCKDAGVVQVAVEQTVFVEHGDTWGYRRRDQRFVVGVLHIGQQLRGVLPIEQLPRVEEGERSGRLRRGQGIERAVVANPEGRRVVVEPLVADGLHDEAPGLVVALLDHLPDLELCSMGPHRRSEGGLARFDEAVVGRGGQDLGRAGGYELGTHPVFVNDAV